ncbi:hypothetical protein B0H15DRAFT_950007 [Mycena belliarum]|uniref:Uncharacterized protein n=1 Tax=Mycena belliarum TaxID=1033014 RepID=A0AAD6U2S2_9AGAR|nr:hypothetical protein B0H15DRAFT_950007 [Mycena belliae]
MSDRSDAADAPNLGDFRDRLFHRSVPLPACVGPGDSAGVCSAQVHTRTSPVPVFESAVRRAPTCVHHHFKASPPISTSSCSPPLRAGHAEHPPRWALLPSEDAPGAPVEAPRAAPAEAPANPRGAVLARLRVVTASRYCPALAAQVAAVSDTSPSSIALYLRTPRFTPSARRPPPRTPPRPIRTPRPLPPAHDSHVPPPVLRVALGSAPLRAMGRPLHAARRIPPPKGTTACGPGAVRADSTSPRPAPDSRSHGEAAVHRLADRPSPVPHLRLTSPHQSARQSTSRVQLDHPPTRSQTDVIRFQKTKTGPRLAEGDCDEFLASDLLETEP